MSRSATVVAAAALLLAALGEPAAANGWKRLTNQPPGRHASTMFLLMDGRVLMNDNLSTKWWILTPTASGSYTDGTWTAAADSHDDRLYYGSGVLRDGRVIVAGGEYTNTGGSDKVEIYDPVSDTWTVVPPPAGFGYIGDAPSVVLADGRFFMAKYNARDTAIYDPATNAWTPAAKKLNSSSLEETWTLLPDGTVLTADCPGHPGSELYDPVTDTWTSLGNTPVDLVDGLLEIGSALMMNDGQVVCFGATPHTCHYTPSPTPGGVGTWTQGGDPPLVGGSSVSNYDASSAILPSGNLLVMLGSGFSPPTYMFEYDGVGYVRVPDPTNNGVPAYYGRFLVLPTGKVLYAADSVQIYTPDGSPDPAWLPAITSCPTDLVPGESYVLSGTQITGRSSGTSFGDECYIATNYPIVKLKFASGNTRYCRAFDPSTMGYATGAAIHSTRFEVPQGETGAAKLTVISNGLASPELDVMVRDPITIDFDALATGVTVTNQYPEALFSSQPGFENATVAAGAGASAPNMAATRPVGGAPDATHDTLVDFPCPIASLTFQAIGVDSAGTAATVDVWSDGALAGSVDVVGSATPATPVRVDCTAFPRVTRIEIHAIADAGGIAWDDFRFCLASTASWANYGAGFPGTLGVPSFTVSVLPVIGTTMTADLANSAGVTTLAVVLVGDQQASLPLGKGGTLLLVPLLSFSLSIAPGSTPLDADVEDDPTLCGLSFFAQALELDAGAVKGVSSTAGLELVVGY